MKASSKPKLYIIAGPNGAGKTTFAVSFLPKYVDCFEFVNADLIAGGLSPFNAARADLPAGKLMLERINFLARNRVDFAFETTLSGKSYLNLLRQIKESGYHICLFFLWIPDVRLALQRVADRVKRGGHNIPSDTVRRRFERGIYNFFHLYRSLCDMWMLFDNSTDDPAVIAYEIASHLKIVDNSLFAGIKKKVEMV